MIEAALRSGGALSGMAEYRQFILYRVVPAHPKPRKLSVSPYTGHVIDAYDSTQWVDAETALACSTVWNANVAFVLSERDPFWFLDIDGAYTPNRGWSDTAKTLCQYFSGAAIEVSQSNTGLHIFGRGTVPQHGCKNGTHGLEFYTEKRFVALTGTNATGTVNIDWTAHLSQFVPQYFPVLTLANADGPIGWTTEPLPDWRGPTDDDELIARMLRQRASAAASFGAKASFAELWNADAAALARALPDTTGARPYDASSADFSLALHLAWWTGGNCERIERLMRRSALVRDKWDQHSTYLRNFTIQRAVSANGSKCYVERNSMPADAAPVTTTLTAPTTSLAAKSRGGTKYLDPAQQLDFFAGCVYVRELDRVLTPSGMLMNSAQFNGTYGGYVFKMDNANTAVTKKPWEAFVMSLAFEKPTVDRTFFNPRLPPRAVEHRHDQTAVNVWVPRFGERRAGNPQPFLDDIARLLPDPSDQRILLAYMAACVQHVGVKFRWAVVLQGIEGNGKSLTAECLSYALGPEYIHTPRASKLLSDNFNGWQKNKLLIVINDFKADAKTRDELMEVLKPMITDTKIGIRDMNVAEMSVEVFCNYLFTMNDREGMKKHKTDRRYCILFTDQQEDGDLERCGMSGAYFARLTRWLEQEHGYAIVADYLATVAIPDELNPATLCQRAPATSRLNEVFRAGMSSSAELIVGAAEDGRIGLQGGYMSAAVVKQVLTEAGIRNAGPKAIAKLMNELDYVVHPRINNGRLTRPMPWDNGVKPLLYVKRGHLSLNFSGVDAVTVDFTRHQALGITEAATRFASIQ